MIFCFSGTGNSLWVAQRISHNLGDEIKIINNSGKYESATCERAIWVFPIYSWGVPPVVVDFMKNTNLPAKSRHYMVCTCGDDIGNAHLMWRKIINRRGWIYCGAYSVIMPNTYTLMKGFDVDSPEIMQKKLDDAPARVDHISQAIDHDNHIYSDMPVNDVTTGQWAWIKTRIIYPYFVKFCMSPRPFHANENCISCGKCSRECPLSNITMNGNRPDWGNNCALCLRCYHICPQHAVNYGKATRHKGQYLHP